MVRGRPLTRLRRREQLLGLCRSQNGCLASLNGHHIQSGCERREGEAQPSGTACELANDVYDAPEPLGARVASGLR